MRQHSIKTTYLIHSKLASSADVLENISENNIFLLGAEPEVKYPYAVIKRTGIQSERGNKDFAGDIVFFTISVYSDKYEVAADIADAMRFALEGWIFEDDTIRLENITITSATEDWVADAYEQSISFRAEVLNPQDSDED